MRDYAKNKNYLNCCFDFLNLIPVCNRLMLVQSVPKVYIIRLDKTMQKLMAMLFQRNTKSLIMHSMQLLSVLVSFVNIYSFLRVFFSTLLNFCSSKFGIW